MDKKAREKIDKILTRWGVLLAVKPLISQEILQALEEPKPPKDKPPLLRADKISDIVLRCYTDNKLSCVEWAVEEGCQAQREADIKHYEGK